MREARRVIGAMAVMACLTAARAGTLFVDVGERSVVVTDPSPKQAQALAADYRSCLTIENEAGGTFQVQIPGPILYDGDGRIVWSPGQLVAIDAAAGTTLSGDEFAGLFDLRDQPWFADGPTPLQIQDHLVPAWLDATGVESVSTLPETPAGELSPACGQCLNGYSCVVYPNRPTCCTGAGNCQKCKVCGAGRVETAE